MNEEPTPEDARPAISVVIPTYNRAQRLPVMIEALLGQTLHDLEVIVVDDGSEDETREVVTAITDPRVRYVSRPNGGISAARNTGAAQARGRAVVFIDDDDRPDTDWLSSMLDRMDSAGAAVVSCGARFVDPDGRPVGEVMPHDLGPAFENLPSVMGPHSCCVTREVFDAVGGYAEGIEFCHQTEFALRLLPWCAAHDRVVDVVDRPLLTVERRGASDRPAASPSKLLDGTVVVLETHGDRLARDPALLADFHGVAGVAAARLGDYASARRHLAAAFRVSPRPEQFARLILACVPPVGRRVWSLPGAAGAEGDGVQ